MVVFGSESLLKQDDHDLSSPCELTPLWHLCVCVCVQQEVQYAAAAALVAFFLSAMAFREACAFKVFLWAAFCSLCLFAWAVSCADLAIDFLLAVVGETQ